MASVAKREWTYKGQKRTAWVVRYEATGKHRSRQFALKKEADAYRTKVESEIKAGVHAPASEAGTIGALAKRYIQTQEQMMKEGRLARGTYAKEVFYLDSHILPRLASMNVATLTKADADGFLSDLRRAESRRLGHGTLKPATIKQIGLSLSRMLDFAIRRGVLHINVMREVARWKEHRVGSITPIRTFTPRDVQALLQSLEERRSNQFPRSQALTRATVYLAAFCGLRLGEVMGLKWQHVDFDARTIRVRHSLDAWDTLRPPKTKAGSRDVPMPDIVARAMQVWEPWALPEKRGLVFRTDEGKHLPNQNFHVNYWRRALDAADLGPLDGRRFHFHALRHFYASMLIQKGLPLTDAAELLGHSSWDMTLQVYAHPTTMIEHRRSTVDGIVSTLLLPPAAQDLRKSI